MTCVAGSGPVGCEAHGKAQGPLPQSWRLQARGRTGGATIREPLLMPRHEYIPGWAVVPGCQGPAAERRQAAAEELVTASEHRCPRGTEGARPGPGLMRAERGNLVRVCRAGAGMRRRGSRPTVRGAESRGGTGCSGSECRRLKGSRKAGARGAGSPPGNGARITGRIPGLVPGPARALT